MNTLNFLDANVWLALIWSQHMHSEKARSWFERASNNEEQFFFCRFTQLTVLRLLTTDQVMGKNTKTMSEAWSLWDRVWADTSIPLPVATLQSVAQSLGGFLPSSLRSGRRLKVRHL